MICFISHVAAADPSAARSQIRDAADKCDGITREMAKLLGVSYPTLLRLFDRLGLRAEIRTLWLERRRARKEAGR